MTLEARPKRLRTVAQIFTSRGKRTAEDRARKAIAFDASDGGARAIAFEVLKAPKAMPCSLCPVAFALRNPLKTPRFAPSIRCPTCGARLVAAQHQQHQQQQHQPTDSSALSVPVQRKPAQSPVIASLSRSTLRLRLSESWIGRWLTPSFGIDRVKRHPQACSHAPTPTNGGSQSAARL